MIHRELLFRVPSKQAVEKLQSEMADMASAHSAAIEEKETAHAAALGEARTEVEAAAGEAWVSRHAR